MSCRFSHHSNFLFHIICVSRFDLGGYTKDQVITLVTTAFKEPLDLKEMLRFSFVIWNNQNKAKYDKDLMKNLTSALRDIGFEDNSGASLDFSCGGNYKYQHDTGLNIKVIHVFPRANQVGGGAAAGGEDGYEEYEERSVDVDSLAPDYLCTIVEMDSFQKMVSVVAQKERALPLGPEGENGVGVCVWGGIAPFPFLL